MSRVKRGVISHRRHKRVLKQTKGYWGQRSNIFRRATETLLRAMAFAFKSRKLRKRDFRSMFITRVNAASRQHGLSYSVFIHKMNVAKVAINRKMLSQLSIYDPKAFEAVVAKIK
jgi:large subunit ribosomal protein L20